MRQSVLFIAIFVLAMAGCGDDSSGTQPECGNGVVETGEQCDGTDHNGETCEGLGHQGGVLACSSTCQFDETGCVDGVCGDGNLDPDEECDGSNVDNQTCASQGFVGGVLACSDECTLDTTDCHQCGNGVLDTGEECDVDALDGETCQSQGFDRGELTCTSGCSFDTSACSSCGDSALDAGEECDDGNTLSGDGCSASCIKEKDLVVVGTKGTAAGVNAWWIKKIGANGDEVAVWDNTITGGDGAYDIAHGVAADSSGRIYVAGTITVSGRTDCRVLRLTNNGGVDLTYDFGTSGSYDNAYAITIDATDNIYVGGSTSANWWLRRLDTTLSNELLQTYPDGWNDYVFALGLDNNGAIYMGGMNQTVSGDDGYDAQLKKVSLADLAVVAWDQVLDASGLRDNINDVVVDSNNDVYAVGIMTVAADDTDGWVMKFDEDGNALWSTSFGSANGNDGASGAAVTAAGDLYVVGYRDNGMDYDWWIKKYDSLGIEDTVSWNLVFDSGTGHDTASNVVLGADGNVYVVGNRHNGADRDWWIMKLDSQGNQLWERSFDGFGINDYANAAVAVDAP